VTVIWLPFPNTQQSLDVLTDEHVFDVVFQGMQCLRNIYTGEVRWRDARMWASHPAALLLYVQRANREMVKRGYPAEGRVVRAHVALSREGYSLAPVPPWWFGNQLFHMTQRSQLIKVNPAHYAQRLPFNTPLEMKVFWPTGRGLL
jgi:hypothetical protein